MSVEEVTREATRLVEPGLEERRRVDAVAREVLDRARSRAEESAHKPRVILGGSYARDTWLSGEADIDVFLLYDERLDEKEFRRGGLSLALRILEEFGPRVRYAEHPYAEAFIEGVRVNVVPCFAVKPGRWRSAADRSPYHTEFMVRNLSEEQRRDVRLLKRFAKAAGVYGAEVKVQGFSGYACEILIYNYGTFVGALRAISEWGERVVVSRPCEEREVLERFPDSKFLLIDPIDRGRNLGAAISPTSVSKLVLASRMFLRSPSPSFFEVRRVEPRPSPLTENLLVLLFEHEEKPPDVLWGELKRSEAALKRQLELSGFRVYRVLSASDEVRRSAFLILLESRFLPKFELREGPLVRDERNVREFVRKNRSALDFWISGERVYAVVARRMRSAEDLLRIIASAPEKYGVSKGLAEGVRRSELHEYESAIRLGLDWLNEGLREIVDSSDKAYLAGGA